MKILFLAGFLLTAMASVAQVRQDTSIYRIETLDGNEYLGHILSQDGGTIALETERLGIIRIARSDVRKLERISQEKIRTGSYWFDNPQSTRYFWQNNGYGLRKGEGYYQNVWVFFNQFTYGVSDNLSIGVGLIPLFLFAAAPTPAWLGAKLSIPIVEDEFNLGIGGLGGTVLGIEAEGAGFVFTYGTATLGSRDRNMSLGVGYGLVGGEFADLPIINVSGLWRTGQRGYLMTENYLLSTAEETVVMLSIGGRRMIGKAGLDFGLWFPLPSDIFLGLPWLGVSIPFGNSPL